MLTCRIEEQSEQMAMDSEEFDDELSFLAENSLQLAEMETHMPYIA